MIAATGATVWLVAEIRKEQRAVQEILAGSSSQAIKSVGTLSLELRWQFVVTILVSLVLMSAAIGLVILARAYLKSEASLLEVRIHAEHILASIHQGVVTTDSDGRITSTNARARQLLGLDRGCVGKYLAAVCSPETPLDQLSQQVLANTDSQAASDYAFTRGGHQARLHCEGQVLRGDGESILGTVLLIRDVTERTLMEQRIQRMQRFMGLGTLVAGLHHEIKNPLSALSLHVQLLEERMAGQMDEEVAENLGVLKAEVARIVGILEKFGDYASIERLNLSPTNVADAVRHTISVIRPKADQQQVQIDLRFSSATLPRIVADRARLEQVLLNLVINALDQMQSGGKLTIELTADERSLAIVVADTGPGIPENIRSRIFDPYFTTKRRGLGMGLALCEKVVREHGGQIDAESSAAGTQFRITLPVQGPVEIAHSAALDRPVHVDTR
jgi:PAS domain S-box-containing protein